MKIVCQITFFGNVNNRMSAGVEKLILSYCKYFKNFHPVILSRGKDEGVSIDGVMSYNFSENSIKNRIFNKILGLKVMCFDSLVTRLNQIKPDVLHFHNRSELVDSVVRKLKFKPLVICHLHNYYHNYKVPHTASAFIANSHKTKERFGQFSSSSHVEVMPNPIPFDYEFLRNFEVSKNTRPVRSFFFAGGGAAHKGSREVLEAFTKFKDDFSDAEIIICGPSTEKLDKAMPGVTVIGQISPDEYRKRLLEADCLLSPSHREPFGVAL